MENVSECCCPEPIVATRATCPSCRQAAAGVEPITVEALLTAEALARLNLARFYFCSSEACDTVYFSDAGQVFRIADMTVQVWHKHAAGDRTFCYCFSESETAMRSELARSGRIAAIERVRHHIAKGRCACDIRNPRGVCCLGDLSRAAESFFQENQLATRPQALSAHDGSIAGEEILGGGRVEWHFECH